MIHPIWVAKVIAASLIPKLVHDSYIHCKKYINSCSNKKTISRQKPDTTKWTKFSYDIVMKKRKTWVEYNKKPINGRIPLSTLIADINHTLNMHKSSRAIAAIWEGKIDRAKLQKGGPLEQTKK